jgi:putative aldouronate transport system permease protein
MYKNVGAVASSKSYLKPHKYTEKKRKIWRDWRLYLMFVPGLISLIIFCYVPMYGLQLAFKDYKASLGIWNSPWCENLFDNFTYSVATHGFWNLVKNTLILGGLKMLFAFPSSIILALLINEVGFKPFKKTVQTLSYLPYFISWVIVNAILQIFLKTELTAGGAVLNNIIQAFGGQPIEWYNEPKYWRAIITITNIWKNMGWGTIVFLAALTNINPDLYEAAQIDGAGYWKQCVHVTIPGIMSTICMTLILSISGIVKDDFEQIYALAGEGGLLDKTMEVLGTWIYKSMHNTSNFYAWGQATAVGMVQSLIGMILVATSNFIVTKSGNEGLW